VTVISLRFHIVSPVTKDIGFSGPPLRASFLNKVREYHEDLSNEAHGGPGIRQYTIDPLPSQRGFNTLLERGKEYTFGVNLFQSDKFRGFVRSLMDQDELQFRVYENRLPVRRMDILMCNIQTMMHEWVDAPEVLEARRARITMRFETPTQLAHTKSDALCLFPMPEKVFPSLLKIWASIGRVNSLYPVQAYREWVRSDLLVSRHDVRTRPLKLGPRLRVVGFTGRVDFVVNDMQTPMARMTVGLAKFAESCGVGKHRTAGLGKVTSTVMLAHSERGSDVWTEFDPHIDSSYTV